MDWKVDSVQIVKRMRPVKVSFPGSGGREFTVRVILSQPKQPSSRVTRERTWIEFYGKRQGTKRETYDT